MDDEQTIREKFEGMTPAEKARLLRCMRALLADDGGDSDEAEYIAAHMSDLLSDLDRFASYYDEVARQEKRRAEAEDRRAAGFGERMMNEYAPNTVSHPGETLREVMSERGMTAQHLATLSGYSADQWQRVLDCKARMSYDMARWLDHVFGTDRFWVRRVRQHYVQQRFGTQEANG